MGSAVAMSDAFECQRRLTLRRISPSEIMPSMILSLTTIATPKDFSDMITTVSAMGVSGATMGSESPVCMRSATCTNRSEEHTSELQSLMRISYAVFCLKKKKKKTTQINHHLHIKIVQKSTTKYTH